MDSKVLAATVRVGGCGRVPIPSSVARNALHKCTSPSWRKSNVWTVCLENTTTKPRKRSVCNAKSTLTKTMRGRNNANHVHLRVRRRIRRARPCVPFAQQAELGRIACSAMPGIFVEMQTLNAKPVHPGIMQQQRANPFAKIVHPVRT